MRLGLFLLTVNTGTPPYEARFVAQAIRLEQYLPGNRAKMTKRHYTSFRASEKVHSAQQHLPGVRGCVDMIDVKPAGHRRRHDGNSLELSKLSALGSIA
jgi:hypothetical protein